MSTDYENEVNKDESDEEGNQLDDYKSDGE